MRLEFAGVGNAFCEQGQWQTNAVLTKDDGDKRCLLIDCGSDARFSLKELGVRMPDIGGVYVSHLHADHVGGLEWLAFCTYFVPTLDRPKLFCDYTLMHKLWEGTLRGGLDSIEGKVMTLTDYFDCEPVMSNGFFEWGNAQLTPVQTVHVMAGYQIVHSFGLMIEWPNEALEVSVYAGSGVFRKTPLVSDGRKKVFYTADTQFCPHQIEKFYNEAHLIFQDCETGPHKSGVHAHFDDLCMLPNETKAKMWLMHYKQSAPMEDMQEIARGRGFAGFVEKGQSFDLAAI